VAAADVPDLASAVQEGDGMRLRTHRDALGGVVEAADVPDHADAVEDGGQQGRDLLRVRGHEALAGFLQAQKELQVVLCSHRLPAGGSERVLGLVGCS